LFFLPDAAMTQIMRSKTSDKVKRRIVSGIEVFVGEDYTTILIDCILYRVKHYTKQFPYGSNAVKYLKEELITTIDAHPYFKREGKVFLSHVVYCAVLCILKEQYRLNNCDDLNHA
jgi:hypothetical protein